jgi:hypothetical protein
LADFASDKKKHKKEYSDDPAIGGIVILQFISSNSMGTLTPGKKEGTFKSWAKMGGRF